jgi:hypothetical protein
MGDKSRGLLGDFLSGTLSESVRRDVIALRRRIQSAIGVLAGAFLVACGTDSRAVSEGTGGYADGSVSGTGGEPPDGSTGGTGGVGGSTGVKLIGAIVTIDPKLAQSGSVRIREASFDVGGRACGTTSGQRVCVIGGIQP